MIRKLTTREIFKRSQSRTVPDGFNHTRLWLHNIRSMHNVGSAFRSADAFGIGGLILSGYTPVPPRPELTKTALGAEKTVAWNHFDTSEQVLKYLAVENVSLVGLEQTGKSIPVTDLTLPVNRKICLLMGNEVTGIDNSLLAYCHQIVEIPQYGQKHSFNVSVAVGIALFALHEIFRTE